MLGKKKRVLVVSRAAAGDGKDNGKTTKTGREAVFLDSGKE